jgi:hypothetical protein
MSNIKQEYLKKIAEDILNGINNEYKWLNIKLKKHFRIDSIDKDNNYFVKPNDCRWWFGNTKANRYKNLCRKVPRGNRKDMQTILEYIIILRTTFSLFIPEHPIDKYKFEKNITCPGLYQLCYNGIVVNKINNNEEQNECPICYEKLDTDKNYIALKCCHKFCSDCIFKHFSIGKNECPLCRSHFSNIKVTEILSDIDEYPPSPRRRAPPTPIHPNRLRRQRTYNAREREFETNDHLNGIHGIRNNSPLDSPDDYPPLNPLSQAPPLATPRFENTVPATVIPTIPYRTSGIPTIELPPFIRNDANLSNIINNQDNHSLITALDEISTFYNNIHEDDTDINTIHIDTIPTNWNVIDMDLSNNINN